MIIGRVGSTMEPRIILALVQSQAVPSLLYCAEALKFSPSNLKRFDHAFNGVFAKLFYTWNSNILDQCMLFSGFVPNSYIIALKRFKFLRTLANDNDDYFKLLMHNFPSVSSPTDSLCGFQNNDSDRTLKYRLFAHFETQLEMRKLN
jgi:hypothetical protein